MLKVLIVEVVSLCFPTLTYLESCFTMTKLKSR